MFKVFGAQINIFGIPVPRDPFEDDGLEEVICHPGGWGVQQGDALDPSCFFLFGV